MCQKSKDWLEHFRETFLISCQIVRLSDCLIVRWSDGQMVRWSDCQIVRLSYCQIVRLSDRQIVRLWLNTFMQIFNFFCVVVTWGPYSGYRPHPVPARIYNLLKLVWQRYLPIYMGSPKNNENIHVFYLKIDSFQMWFSTEATCGIMQWR